ncbi:hypothetical protein JCM9492_13540 [Aquifex pyrophilus]
MANKVEREINISREIVKRRLKELLNRDNSLCIVVRGDWGVGKTSLWKEFAKEELNRTKYVYISLFGKKSINDIKDEIMLQLYSYKRVLKPLGEILKNIKVEPAIHSIGNLLSLLVKQESTLKDVIICFDEFERKSTELRPEEILGLISFLKENSNCKLVLIMNEEEIKKENSKYNDYKEKVVDYEIRFNPSVEENLKIVFDSNKHITNSMSEEAKRSFEKVVKRLKITNIRLLTRMLNAYSDFSFIDERFPDLTDEVGYIKEEIYERIFASVYLAAKYNWHEDFANQLSAVVKKINEQNFNAIKKKVNEQEKLDISSNLVDEDDAIMTIEEFLAIKGFLEPLFTLEDYVYYINDYLRYGIITDDIKSYISSLIEKRLKAHQNETVASQFRELLNKLRFNYTEPIDRVVEDIKKFLTDEKVKLLEVIPLMSFIGDLLFLHEFTKDDFFSNLARDIFKQYLEKVCHEHHKQVLDYEWNEDIKYHLRFMEPYYKEIVAELMSILEQRIKEAKNAILSELDCEKIKGIMENIIKQSGWGYKEENILNSLDKEFIKNCLEKSPEFVKYSIDLCGKFAQSFKNFLITFKEAVEELDIEPQRKEYLTKRLLIHDRTPT